MSKQYRFTIVARLFGKNSPTSTHTETIARNVYEAKNKFKALRPNAIIVSCVRNEEVPDYSKNTNSGGGSLGTVLLGVAATAGIGLAMSLFKKSKE